LIELVELNCLLCFWNNRYTGTVPCWGQCAAVQDMDRTAAWSHLCWLATDVCLYCTESTPGSLDPKNQVLNEMHRTVNIRPTHALWPYVINQISTLFIKYTYSPTI